MVVWGGAVREVVGEAKSRSSTMSDVGRPTDPAMSVDDDVTRLRVCTDSYVDTDNHRRLIAAELDVDRCVVL